MRGYFPVRRDRFGRIIPLPPRAGLSGIPPYDLSYPGVAIDSGVFSPPGGPVLPGSSYTPPPPVPGAPVITDWRVPNLVNWISFQITPSFIKPILPVDYHRQYIEVQNNDTVGILFITFGVQPQSNGGNAINVNPGLGFIIDQKCPFTPMYVASNIALTVNPSANVGSEVSPATIPQNV
jgi:hypothetical protein